MANVVLVRVLESLGMAERTAKSTATKLTNKLSLERDEAGFVSVQSAIDALTAQYLGEKTTSKYKEAAVTAVAALKANKLDPNWQTAVVAAPKANPFAANKVLKAIKAMLAEQESITLADIEAIEEEINTPDEE